MVSVYTEDGPGRVEILASDRTVHEKGTDCTSDYRPVQVRDVANRAIPQAAAAGHDPSGRLNRIRTVKSGMPKL